MATKDKRTNNGTRFDGRKVYLPNSSKLGFAHYNATPGKMITFTLGERDAFGVVIGRIAEGKHTGHLVVMMLGTNLGFAYENWVAPEEVTECYDIPSNFFRWLANSAADMAKKSPTRLLKMQANGSLSNRYIANPMPISGE